MSDERYVSDGNWPAARSERREDGARSGLGTMARPGGRPRPGRAGEPGPATQEPGRGRQARPVPPQRPAAAGARPATGAPWRVTPARRAAVPRPATPRGPQQEPARYQEAPGQAAQPQQPGALAAAAGPHRMPFVLLLCGLLGGALISALVISTTLAEGSFKISKLQDSTSALARQRQALEAQVAQAQSAQVIEERAAQLGMRRAGELRFVNLKTGKVTDDGPVWAGAVNAPGYAP
jgi:hypothetical protein